ncbi:hypothetical protein N7457_007788, partial [Penicillium paradoxum]|uniref:uncharacterized protein n=1 Tax=Penicillium paradoxum TaxID=176176 RepID=UPI0025470AA9
TRNNMFNLPNLPNLPNHPTATSSLNVLVGSIFLYYLHRKISQRMLNNFQPSEAWNPEKELVLLTGGSGGIGQQIAEDLSRQKVRVVILDLNRPTFELPENVIFYQTDITSSQSISETAAIIRKTHGDPTVLVNNAGITDYSTILDVEEKKLRRMFDVNVVAHFLTVKEFLPAMIRAGSGHVVTIASVASFVTVGEMVHYACTKAGALAFHEGLRQELIHWYKAPNIRTSVVHPLWVQTPMIKGYTDYQSDFRQSVMNPKAVSEAVIEHITSRQSGQIILPRARSLIGSLRALPLWLQEMLRSSFSAVLWRVGDKRAADAKVADSPVA